MAQKITKREEKQYLFEVSFYRQLTAGQPDYVEALIPLGNAYTKLGMYAEGLEVDLQLCRLRPETPTVWYNLACSYSLLERIDAAFEALGKAVRWGYNDFAYMDEDPDLENLRKDQRYQNLRLLVK